MTGRVILTGAPLGNTGDASARLRDTLATADGVAAEDTRRLARLARDLDVTVTGRIVSYFEGNEERRTPELVEALRAGATVAVVTDGGMPSVSDPGYRLVRAALDAGFPVTAAPGPSAVTTAIALSGLPSDRFVFEGFLPRAGRARTERLAALAAEPRTIVLFESPRRLARTMGDLLELGDRRVAVVRELTKLHQEVIRGALSEVLESIGARELKGEVVVVVEGATVKTDAVEEAVRVARDLVAEGATKRDAARRAKALTGTRSSANEIYRRLTSR
jgi:16S rRNA (cytidine1402-2'-O)-methyltransferase